MATVTRENIGLLHDKLTLKINKEDYYPSFEKAIKNYSKKANIPGFRKGMVPAGMVKKMYGSSVFYDEIIKAVEQQMTDYLTKEKPDIFAHPLPLPGDLRNLDMNDPQDYEFSFEIGLKPKIEIDALTKASPVFYKVKVTDEMIEAELDRLQIRHGKMSEPEMVTTQDAALNVSFVETDSEGNPVENNVSKEISLLIKNFTEEYRNQLMNKKKDDFIILQLDKAFDEKEREWIIVDLGFDKEDISAADKYFKMTITNVSLVEKREMNEEFFGEAFPGKQVKTEGGFRDQVKEEIQQYWDAQSRIQLHDQLYHILLDMPIQFPEEFLKRWLQGKDEKEKSVEQTEAEFPSFANQLKWTLISDKIINDNNLQISDEELKDSMRREIMQYFGQMKMDDDTGWMDSYIDRMMKDKKQVNSSYTRLITNKLFTWAQSQVALTEKEVSAEEFTAMHHNHHH